MPDNPAGVYSLPPSYKVANGQFTNANQHNPPFEDIAQALSDRMHRDGRTAVTGDWNMNGFRLTNIGAATDPNDAVTAASVEAMIDARVDDAFWLASTM